MKYQKNEVIGRMRDRITIQNVTRSKSSSGFVSEKWKDILTVWSNVNSKIEGSDESLIDGKNTAKTTTEFIIRKNTDLTENSRILWNENIYQVKNIQLSHDRRFTNFTGIFFDSYSLKGGAIVLLNSSFSANCLLAGSLTSTKFVNASLNANGILTDATLTAILPFSATGGTITIDGAYTVHTFTSSGTFTPNKEGSVDYLVVAGGGGGGRGNVGGGGGAGGFRTAADFAVTPTELTVTIGAGGGGAGSSINGSNGSNTVFSSITATGGGGGATTTGTTGSNGGSGGGGTRVSADGGTGAVGQGNNGGAGSADSGANISSAGGGGGANAVGSTGGSGIGGNGGAGTANSYSGSSVTYAGGGGGASDGTGTQGAGGTGGGGDAKATGIGTAGTVNTGGGGGGGGGTSDTNGGAGGSGIVIIRYLT